MGICVRKISKGKWPDEEILEKKTDEEVLPILKADALTSCLRTSNNELSLWVVPDHSDAEIDKAVLALITNSRLERLDRLAVIYFDEELIKTKGLNSKESDGDTIVEEYKRLHKDLVNLNFSNMEEVSKIITSAIRQKKLKKYNETYLFKLLADAIVTGLVDESRLHPNLQKKLAEKKNNSKKNKEAT